MGRVVVYCQPGARQTRIAGLHDGKPKIQLKAPPVDGEANAALLRFVARRLGVAPRAVALVRGASSREKWIRVEGFSAAAVRTALLS